LLLKKVEESAINFSYIAILAGVVNFLPHPSPPREFGEGVRNLQMI
jgi:hypothetical protein